MRCGTRGLHVIWHKAGAGPGKQADKLRTPAATNFKSDNDTVSSRFGRLSPGPKRGSVKSTANCTRPQRGKRLAIAPMLLSSRPSTCTFKSRSSVWVVTTTNPGGGALKRPGPARGKQSDGHRARLELSRTDTRQTRKARGAAGAGGGAHERTREAKGRLGQKLSTQGRREPAQGRSCRRQRGRRHVATPWSGLPKGPRQEQAGPPWQCWVEPRVKEPLASIAESAR